MSKIPQQPAHAPAIPDEAMAVARSIQKPGQTKEQTKLIAQGIAKGIELYKRQQSAKSRERDKSRKRFLTSRHAEPSALATETGRGSSSHPLYRPALLLTLCGGLFLFMSAVHVIRLVAGWDVVLGSWPIPAGASLIAAVLLAGLSVWCFLSARQL